MNYAVSLTKVSTNVKTGPIPVSMTSDITCPAICPFATANEGGCYASYGTIAIHWRRLNDGRKAGMAWDEFCGAIAKLPKNSLWRHNQAGDLPGIGNDIDVVAMKALVKSNKGRKGFTYTHKDVSVKTNRDAIKYSNDNGFIVNLSANNLDHADRLKDMNIGPVVVVVPIELGRKHSKANKSWVETEAEYKARIGNISTPKGNAVIVCLATYKDDVSCATCGICATLRKAIIAFPAHGTGKNKVNAITINRINKIVA